MISSEIKDKEKTYHTSSVINLLNKSRIFSIKDNNTKLAKEELNMELPNNYLSKYNKRNKVLKPIRTNDYSEDKDKIKNETTITKREIKMAKERSRRNNLKEYD